MVVFSCVLVVNTEMTLSIKWCMGFACCDFPFLHVDTPQLQVNPELGLLPVWSFSRSFCVCVGFLWVFWFPRTIQKHDRWILHSVQFCLKFAVLRRKMYTIRYS